MDGADKQRYRKIIGYKVIAIALEVITLLPAKFVMSPEFEPK